ncbi:hypothetical protein [Burkholderia vietnamiensis]|uniref:hypothetical protein n=1 Tax=Burkholderia vietnamiensis TaxID=60552 RepID=UPI001FC8B9FA|nr:hypothetical protein [Burkholderia vietnamiensis]
MNSHYSAFIDLGKTLSHDKGLSWDMPLDETGAACDGVGWNLTIVAGDVPPPSHYLRDLGADAKALAIVNAERAERGLAPLHRLRSAEKNGRQHSVKSRNGGIDEPNPQGCVHEGIS